MSSTQEEDVVSDANGIAFTQAKVFQYLSSFLSVDGTVDAAVRGRMRMVEMEGINRNPLRSKVLEGVEREDLPHCCEAGNDVRRDVCNGIARKCAIAVDFPKSGEPAEPLTVHEQSDIVPDYMFSVIKPMYRSPRLNGQLYRWMMLIR
ncbi:hypothetical protein ANCDUO_00529 [Ancylostoma duodenale]|uniref:RNA-dependent RNA polymerase n=1 Tax=Ancylostoma duodenale TaxID=51022 RepID=A0A0C2HHL3_9BILA|nr:hypothetical protein ANCDUO_00529 [Ancylostoma duodenale]